MFRRWICSGVIAKRLGSLARWGVFVQLVKTASGAPAVVIVHKRGWRVLSLEHIGSAHTDDELAVLLQAGERRNVGPAGSGISVTPTWAARGRRRWWRAEPR